MNDSVFERIGTSLTVKSICTPLDLKIEAGTRIGELEPKPVSADFDPDNDPWQVVDVDGELVGMMWFADVVDIEEEDVDAVVVDELVHHLNPDELLTADTSIFDAIVLFAEKRKEHYYVLEHNEVIGIVRYDDLFKPLSRLAFLALALEIEEHALRLCQSSSVRSGCWESLSGNRKRKAIALFEERYGRSPREKVRFPESPDSVKLLACTNLVDKATMLWKQKLIAPSSRSQILGVFTNLRKLRDKCAHPGEHGPLLAKEEMAPFIISALQLRKNILDAIKIHGSWKHGTVELSETLFEGK